MALYPAHRARLQATLAMAGSVVLWWRFRGVGPSVLMLCTSGFALLAWFAPDHYEPIQRRLDFITRTLLGAFTWLALGIVYFGLFTPLHVWRKLMRSDPLNLRALPTATTYLKSFPANARRRFDRQF